MKRCNKCALTLSLACFNKRADGPGYRAHCKKCCSKINGDRVKKTKQRRKVAMPEAERILKHKEAIKKYKSSAHGKAKHAMRQAQRRADKLRATPKWLTEVQLKNIEFYYYAAKFFSKLWGINIEVDHVIPLKGKIISGLHHPDNLQLMVKEANRQKNNRFPYE